MLNLLIWFLIYCAAIPFIGGIIGLLAAPKQSEKTKTYFDIVE